MIAQIRAELLKIRSTRTTIGLILGMIALILLFGPPPVWTTRLALCS